MRRKGKGTLLMPTPSSPCQPLPLPFNAAGGNASVHASASARRRVRDSRVFACAHMHGGTEQRTTTDRRTVFACARARREERDSQTGWHSLTGVLGRASTQGKVRETKAAMLATSLGMRKCNSSQREMDGWAQPSMEREWREAPVGLMSP